MWWGGSGDPVPTRPGNDPGCTGAGRANRQIWDAAMRGANQCFAPQGPVRRDRGEHGDGARHPACARRARGRRAPHGRSCDRQRGAAPHLAEGGPRRGAGRRDCARGPAAASRRGGRHADHHHHGPAVCERHAQRAESGAWGYGRSHGVLPGAGCQRPHFISNHGHERLSEFRPLPVHWPAARGADGCGAQQRRADYRWWSLARGVFGPTPAGDG